MLWHRLGENGRMIGITIVLTTLYLLLQQIWLQVPALLSGNRFIERPSAAELEQEAKEVAQASKKALQSAPPSARHDTWQLGFHLGYASEFVGSYAMSAADVQAKARQLTEPVLVEANRLSRALGLGPVNPLVTRTLDDFARMTQRIEADETELAKRISETFSPHHRHLFLLGMHLGTEAARIVGSNGSVSLPPRTQIRHHATVTRIPPALWEPLAAAPRHGEQPTEVLARYRDGLTALGANLLAASPVN